MLLHGEPTARSRAHARPLWMSRNAKRTASRRNSARPFTPSFSGLRYHGAAHPLPTSSPYSARRSGISPRKYNSQLSAYVFSFQSHRLRCSFWWHIVIMAGIVLGVGCRACCTLSTLQHLADQLLLQAEKAALPLLAIACWSPKKTHAQLTALAHWLKVPLEDWPTQDLSPYAHRLSHRSHTLYVRTGLWGIAEAAALCSADSHAVAQECSTLLIPRTVAPTCDATGAIAIASPSLPCPLFS